MSQQKLSIAGNEYISAKHDDAGNVVSACCDVALRLHPRCQALLFYGAMLADDAITWVCSNCGAVALGVETTREDSPSNTVRGLADLYESQRQTHRDWSRA